jgi:hypothetical protein
LGEGGLVKILQAWAQRKPWGVDVFVIVECQGCWRRFGDASFTEVEGAAVGRWPIRCCGEPVEVECALGPALEAGEAATYDQWARKHGVSADGEDVDAG